MKNTKEIKTLLTALYYFNRLGANDEKIENVIEYAFHRLLDSNTNLLLVCTLGVEKQDIFAFVDRMLQDDTEYHKFIKYKEQRHKK